MRTYSAPLFQHRHYAEIAKLLADADSRDDLLAIKSAFAILFQRDNSRFDRDRFMAAANGAPVNGKDKR